jgi:hypothetical protein
MERIKLKRLIAREGLILVTGVLLISIFLALDLNQYNQLREYREYGEVCEIISWPEQSNIVDAKGIYVMFPKDTSTNVKINTLKREYPHISNVNCVVDPKRSPYSSKIDKIFDIQGNLVFNGLFYKVDFKEFGMFVFLAYPLYLIIRFILWSIRTLRVKEERS